MLINDLIGNFGLYHVWLCFQIFMNKFGSAFHHMAIIFLAPPAQYTCPSGGECCDNPVYNTSVFTKTIVTEWNLICDKSWLKDFSQCFFQLGVLMGSLLFGIASDRYGRRPTLIIAMVAQIFLGVMASFLPDFWSFTIARMILGGAVGGVMIIGFVILMEFVGIKYRPIISSIYHIPFAIGHMSLALFGYYLRNYVYFQLSISLFNVILLFYICFLPESVRWLLVWDKTERAIGLIEYIAKVNKLPATDVHKKIALYQIEHKSLRDKKGTVVDLFRTPNLRKNILVMCFLWFCCSYCYYGVSQYISHLTGDVFINVLASGSVCLCACLVSIPLMTLFGRKTIVILSNATNGFCLILIACTPEGIVSVILGCVGVLFSFLTFVVVYLYCTELFPTVVRNAALGISSMMGRFGSMIAPFVAGLRPYGQWCAPVAFGVFPLTAAVLCLMLPETKDCDLMNSIEEGENFGKSPGIVETNAN